ncbi:uncharacterized protein LOC123319966 isoform X2 [Coccinella septempunctata]|uniref:uncharacterized protein LOC123319966 isoform X2 n=1 Tax=Coccinella septempunctata TaxID=41139 RepID=UPI001D0935D6|nr:uncharacterized protein LOC123319966 isoform X2 [Coccinella septempunctata]
MLLRAGLIAIRFEFRHVFDTFLEFSGAFLRFSTISNEFSTDWRKELIPLGQNQLQQLKMENNKFHIIGKARFSSENFFRGLERKKIKLMTIRGEGITPSMDTSDE